VQGWPYFVAFLVSNLGFGAVIQWIERDEPRRFPELALIESEERRSEIWNDARKQSRRSILFFGLLAAWFAVFTSFVRWKLPWLETIPFANVLFMAVVSVGGLLSSLIAIHFSRRAIERLIRVRVAAEGIALCPECGYQTRDLPEPRCPECGRLIPHGICPGCAGDGRTPPRRRRHRVDISHRGRRRCRPAPLVANPILRGMQRYRPGQSPKGRRSRRRLPANRGIVDAVARIVT
jgi:hypothetical protein